jgi:cell division septal protein FtsQ
VAAALATAACAAVVLHLGLSSRYVLAAPVVVGNARLDAAEIVAASGLRGRRIFRAHPTRAAELVAAHPEIKTAEVTVRLPNQAWIRIVETTAVLRWETPTGVFFVDENGLVVEAAGTPPGLIPVHDPGAAVKSAGTVLPPGAVAAAVAYAEEFESLTYEPSAGFIGSTDGVAVRLGTDPAAVPRQVATLAALTSKLQGQPLALVDLRYERPYYRLRQDWGGSE